MKSTLLALLTQRSAQVASAATQIADLAVDGTVPLDRKAQVMQSLRTEMNACMDEWEVRYEELRKHRAEHHC